MVIEDKLACSVGAAGSVEQVRGGLAEVQLKDGGRINEGRGLLS